MARHVVFCERPSLRKRRLAKEIHQDSGPKAALKSSTTTISETESSDSSSRPPQDDYCTRDYNPSTEAVAFLDTRVLIPSPPTQPRHRGSRRYLRVDHYHPDQRQGPANRDSKSGDHGYDELATLFLDSIATGAVVVTTQPDRLDWISNTRINDRLDDRLLVASMRMLRVNRGRTCQGGKKLESVI